MARYRLDERPDLRNLSHNSQVWLERIEFKPDGEIYYTEDYRQVSLVGILKYFARKQSN